LSYPGEWHFRSRSIAGWLTINCPFSLTVLGNPYCHFTIGIYFNANITFLYFYSVLTSINNNLQMHKSLESIGMFMYAWKKGCKLEKKDVSTILEKDLFNLRIFLRCDQIKCACCGKELNNTFLVHKIPHILASINRTACRNSAHPFFTNRNIIRIKWNNKCR
jgi:hypothetical protein